MTSLQTLLIVTEFNNQENTKLSAVNMMNMFGNDNTALRQDNGGVTHGNRSILLAERRITKGCDWLNR